MGALFVEDGIDASLSCEKRYGISLVSILFSSCSKNICLILEGKHRAMAACLSALSAADFSVADPTLLSQNWHLLS